MSLVGEAARVCVPIQDGEEGEVMVSILGGSQPFPARSYDKAAVFEEGERVIILEEAGRVLYVGALD